MSQSINLNKPPFYDDYDPTKNYHKILFRPGTALQARELTQIQDILQNQIERFGDYTFLNGSVVSGCAITFDGALNYVKINDNYISNSQYVDVGALINSTVENQNGLKAVIVETLAGYQSYYNANNTLTSQLNTLYLKYLNTSNNQQFFYANDILTIYNASNVASGQVQVANGATYPVGYGYGVSLSEGTIYNNGYFIDVPAASAVVSPYTTLPDNLSVGFAVTDSIVTPVQDNTLYDNAQGQPNFNAPGAYRLKLTANLVTVNTASQNNNFLSLVNYVQGKAVTTNTTPQLAALGKTIATNIYNEAGDFVLQPFNITVTSQPNTSTFANDYNNVVVSKGHGYIQGYEVKVLNNIYSAIKKGIDTANVNNSVVSIAAGNEIYCNEFCGEFNSTEAVKVELHSTAYKAITNGSYTGVTRNTSDIIGYGYIKAVKYASGVPGTSAGEYAVYFITTELNSGQNINNCRSIVWYDGTSVRGVADVVLNGNNIVQDRSNLTKLVYSVNQPAVKSVSNSQYTFVDRFASSTFSNNSLVVNTGSFSTGYGGLLDEVEAENFYVIPSANLITTNKPGTITTSGSSSIVTGANTTFTSDFIPGDFIYISNTAYYVNSVISDTSLSVTTNPTAVSNGIYQKIYLANVPINFVNTYSPGLNNYEREIQATSNSLTFTFNNDVFSTNTVNGIVYTNVVSANAAAIQKTVNKDQVVKINCANNAGGVNGPWSLGVPDVYKLKHVYVDYTGAYGTTLDLIDNFVLDTGQRDSYYDLAKIKINPVKGVNITNNTTLVVVFDCFTYSTSVGSGFFTIDSYPIDDANTANTSAIQTAEIPIYTSVSDGTVYDLRDSIDFRPVASNTAVVTSNTTAASINPSGTLSFPATALNLVAIDSNFTSDYSYYLGRQDLITLDSSGRLQVVYGQPSLSPTIPSVPGGVSAIGIATVPPYPSLPQNNSYAKLRPDYAVTVQLTQNRRYTMKDIGGLDDRIQNLEYYTSLTLLEQQANNMVITSSSTGLNRFKNGILVDSFQDFTISDTGDKSFKCSIDVNNDTMRPAFNINALDVLTDNTLSNNITNTQNTVISSYNEVAGVTQSYATQTRNCVQYDIWNWKGKLTLSPSNDTTPNYVQNPSVSATVNNAANWVQVANAWQTQYGVWKNVGQPVVTSSVNGSTKTTTSKQTQQQTNQTVKAVNTSSTSNLGNYLQSINISPYVREQFVAFKAVGLRPSTEMYMFINDTSVQSYVIPLTSTQYNNIEPTLGNNNDSVDINWGLQQLFGTTLTTDSSGTCYGLVRIPNTDPSTGWTGPQFNTGSLNFQLCDVSNLATESYDITTSAAATFVSANITEHTTDVSVTTLSTKLQQVTETNTRVVTNTTTSHVSSNLGAGSPPNNSGVTYVQVFEYGNGLLGDYNSSKSANHTVQYFIPAGYTYIYKIGDNYFAPLNNSADVAYFENGNRTQVNLQQVVQNSTQPVLVMEIVGTPGYTNNYTVLLNGYGYSPPIDTLHGYGA